VNSDIQNALSFQYEGYSFIGITLPLIYAVSDLCLRLSRSRKLVDVLGVRTSDKEFNELYTLLFINQTFFVVVHEYTHHVHGHFPGLHAEFDEQTKGADTASGPNAQVQEIDADGYAVYHLLANLLDRTRAPSLALLGLDAAQAEVQDQTLFALIVVAVGAYFLQRPAPNLGDVYALSHPPQAARMQFLMGHAVAWCRQNRPALEGWITGRYQVLMSATAEEALSQGGGLVWASQTAFPRSDAGKAYMSALEEGIRNFKSSL